MTVNSIQSHLIVRHLKVPLYKRKVLTNEHISTPVNLAYLSYLYFASLRRIPT